MKYALSLLMTLTAAALSPAARAVSTAPALPRLVPMASLSYLSPTLAAWSPPPLLLWGNTPDPTLYLTADWRRVFDVAALGAFDVPLRNDPGERTNILLSAQAVDNLTLAPGAEFSFNDTVGERTPERGYQDGLMFDQGKVVRGTGGGICLVATGLYNAALHAGLPIDERHPHSGVVSYAPPGCDAGIYYGQNDLKFRNTTGKPLTIRAVPEGDRVAVRLFGRTLPPGRAVVVKPLALTTLPWSVQTTVDPSLTAGQVVVDQKPRAGYDVTLARYWTYKGRVVKREIVTQEHRAPRPEHRRIGPALVVTPLLPTVTDPLTLPTAPAPAATDAEPGD